MKEINRRHHDNRPHTWNVSLWDEEYTKAVDRWSQSGLTKAEYGRQALMNAKVVSKLDKFDRQSIDDLSHMRADINRLVMICEKQGVEKAFNRIYEIEEKFTQIYNYLLTKAR